MEKDLIKKHLRVLLIIYAILGVMFFAFSYIADNLKNPYQKRDISMEVTPWLK
jgi:hypothetical protein